MNQLTIAGHLGTDPEVRFTSSGQKVTTLRVATRVRRGGGKDETIWYKVTIWGEAFDKMIPFFKKGSAIVVVGELSKPEIFTDREGRPQVSMNLTASNLLFSPFGRTDGAGNSGGESHSSMEHPHAAPSGHAPYGQPHGDSFSAAPAAGSSQGQGKADPAFAEEEIPF